MATRQQLLTSIAAEIADYREDTFAGALDAAHVDKWVRQFDAGVQLGILDEMNHVLRQVYATKKDVARFLENLATNPKLTGQAPARFWKDAQFLKIQQRGESQTKMLEIFDDVLGRKFGFDTSSNSPNAATYIYLDDGLFSGRRLLTDVTRWMDAAAPASFTLHVIVIATHAYGEYDTRRKLEKVAAEKGKTMTLRIWRLVELEDRKSEINASDVLRPKALPHGDASVSAYAQTLSQEGYPPIFRAGVSVGKLPVFSSAAGRHLLEQEFLKAGVRIRDQSPLLQDVMRPLGFHGLRTLGFGTLFATYRNCPNNCPLALWAGEPWYPLLPRRTNSDTLMQSFDLGWP